MQEFSAFCFGEKEVNMEKLFGNPGEKIQKYAIVVFWVLFALSCLLGLLFVVSGLSVANYGYGGSAVLLGLAIIIAGGIGSWVTAIFMCAFGKMCVCLEEINANVKAMPEPVAQETAEVPAEEKKMDYWGSIKQLQDEIEECKKHIEVNEAMLKTVNPEHLEMVKEKK